MEGSGGGDERGICFGCGKVPSECECQEDDDGAVPENIVAWITRQLNDGKDEMGKVSVEHAHQVAVAAGNRVIRAMGGL